jgi:septum site-determining protein MinC
MPTTFEIKSANLSLLALRLMTENVKTLEQDFVQQYGDAPDFFDHDPLVIDLSHLAAQAGAVDFGKLISLMRRYKLAPFAFKGGSSLHAAAALKAGLVAATDLAPARTTEAAQQPPPPVVQPAPTGSAMVIDRPLRSGQKVYARGRDLVVLSMVNAGAEVVADGHIHVYAPLRGKAIAGADGNPEARIFSLHFEPEFLSICGVYRTAEHPIPSEFFGHPAQVRLVAEAGIDKLVMERIG